VSIVTDKNLRTYATQSVTANKMDICGMYLSENNYCKQRTIVLENLTAIAALLKRSHEERPQQMNSAQQEAQVC
jgi:hypothetical protein